MVIVFSSNTEMQLLLAAAQNSGRDPHFIWLGSDGWSGNLEMSHSHEQYLEGAITVQPDSGVVRGKYREEKYVTRDYSSFVANIPSTPTNLPTVPPTPPVAQSFYTAVLFTSSSCNENCINTENRISSTFWSSYSTLENQWFRITLTCMSDKALW